VININQGPTLHGFRDTATYSFKLPIKNWSFESQYATFY